jgi:hypothetical protein
MMTLSAFSTPSPQKSVAAAAADNHALHRVRREKEEVFSGLRDPPGKWIAPAGSSRSDGGGNKAVGAFDAKVAFRATRERAGRNASEQPMRPRNW